MTWNIEVWCNGLLLIVFFSQSVPRAGEVLIVNDESYFVTVCTWNFDTTIVRVACKRTDDGNDYKE